MISLMRRSIATAVLLFWLMAMGALLRTLCTRTFLYVSVPPSSLPMSVFPIEYFAQAMSTLSVRYSRTHVVP
jgi:hypothetical protein